MLCTIFSAKCRSVKYYSFVQQSGSEGNVLKIAFFQAEIYRTLYIAIFFYTIRLLRCNHFSSLNIVHRIKTDVSLQTITKSD